LISTTLVAENKDIVLQKNSLGVTFEELTLKNNEKMGLMGVRYNFENINSYYYGLSLYGTLTGKRGGFFVGGFHSGYRYFFYDDVALDGDLFVGGGGGGSAPQGGGLMLRESLTFLYKHKFGFGYSNITFPNGAIQTQQLFVNYIIPFNSFYFLSATPSKNELQKIFATTSKEEIATTYQIYYPIKNTYQTDKTLLTIPLHLLGISYKTILEKNLFLTLESAGALGGDSTGYMEVLGGVGIPFEIKNFSANLKFLLGSAGGGKVKTDGGAVSKISAEIGYSFFNTKIALGTGYFHSIQNNFNARIMQLSIAKQFNFVVPDRVKKIDFKKFITEKYSLHFMNEHYFYNNSISSKQNNLDIDLVGMSIDLYLNSFVFLSGKACGAYRGDAGGYAEGLFGLGILSPSLKGFRTLGEIDFGAGGGGSLQTGRGTIFKPQIGVQYSFNKRFSFELMSGKIISSGKLKTNKLSFGLVYKFYKGLVQE